jgi:hypothetical protein
MSNKALLDAKFTDYHIFTTIEYGEESTAYWKGQSVAQIAHDNTWKDVWIKNGEIVRVIEVDELSMSLKELELWKEYLNDT